MRKLWLAVLLLQAAPAFCGDDESALEILRARSETADRITQDVLVPILGKGQGRAFVDFGLRLKRAASSSAKLGSGEATKVRRKAASATAREAEKEEDDAFNAEGTESEIGVDTSTRTPATPRNHGDEAAQKQSASQTRERKAEALSLRLAFEDLRIVVLHNKDLPPRRLEEARGAILAIYAGALDPARLQFKPVAYAQPH